MCWFYPREEANDFGLEDKDYTDSSVESAEVGGHGRQIEGRPSHEFGLGGEGILSTGGLVFDGNDLLKQPFTCQYVACRERRIPTSPVNGLAYWILDLMPSPLLS